MQGGRAGIIMFFMHLTSGIEFNRAHTFTDRHMIDANITAVAIDDIAQKMVCYLC